MFSAPSLVTLLDRVKAVVRRLARPGAERARRVPATTQAPVAAISPELHALAWAWMSAQLRLLSALMARIAAGEPLDLPVRGGFTADQEGLPEEPVAGQPDGRLPCGFGWMCGLGPDLRRDGQAFAELLNEPWMKAMVLAAPERMACLIAPILQATGQATPDWFPNAVRQEEHAFPACGQGDPIASVSPLPGSSPETTRPSRLARGAGEVAGDRRVEPGHGDCFIVTTDANAPAERCGVGADRLRRTFLTGEWDGSDDCSKNRDATRASENCVQFVTLS
jgi:hypothetical protein